MANPVLVEILRGEHVESAHRGAVAVCDAKGKTLLEIGNVAQPVFPRSAVKAIQALPLIENGAADALGFGDMELALACASHRGEIVKRLGDGLMAAFWTVEAAAESAFEANARVAAIEVDGYRPTLRTGIHLGRPRKIGGDYFGVDVNIAARLSDAAKPGEVLISGPALAAIDPEAVLASKRRFRAKGAPRDLSAHSIEPA